MRALSILTVMGAAALAGCGGGKRTIKIPESVVASPGKGARKDSPIEPYVIKMSDGKRTWQIEIPATDATGAFQARVPLDLGDAAAAPAVGSGETEADREIRQAIEAKQAGAAPAAPAPEAAPAPVDASQVANERAAKSYLATLARVNALFRKRQYELALIDLVELERDYPDDERLLEMKGTLYWKLRKPKLAREAWERVLALNPENVAVAQALEHLLGE